MDITKIWENLEELGIDKMATVTTRDGEEILVSGMLYSQSVASFNQFQADARRTFEEGDRKLDLLHCTTGVCTEAGELADQVKRHIYYGTPLDITNIVEEVGDIMVYSAALLNYLILHGYTDVALTLENCMEANVAKRKQRFPDKFTKEAAVDRDIEAERDILEGEA